MFHYRVYGLELASDTALPELDFPNLVVGEAKHQIGVRLRVTTHRDFGSPRWVLRSTMPNGDNWARVGKIEGGYLLRYRDLADFIIGAAGTELYCIRIEPGITLTTLRHLLLDLALPLVLNLLGHDVLHATAIDTPAGVCAFIGPTGAGKSTLAASFGAAGYPTFCDDCLVLSRGSEIHCTPGYPGVRLWQDSVAAVNDHRVKSGKVARYRSKLRLTVRPGQFPHLPRPLAAIYRISRAAADEPTPGSSISIEPLTGRQAFMELVASSYVLDVTDPGTLSRHFRCAEQLVTQIPVVRLRLPNDFACLPTARRAILQELKVS